MANATKGIIVELNKDLKLDGDNYAIWQQKVQFILTKQETLEMITETMIDPGDKAMP